MTRPTRPIEPSLTQFAADTQQQATMLRAAVKSKHGKELTELEAIEYLNYCHHIWMMRVMFAASSNEETLRNLQAILADVGIDCSHRLQARFTGTFPAPSPKEQMFATPEALEEMLATTCNDPNCKTCSSSQASQPFEPAPSAKLADGTVRHNGYL